MITAIRNSTRPWIAFLVTCSPHAGPTLDGLMSDSLMSNLSLRPLRTWSILSSVRVPVRIRRSMLEPRPTVWHAVAVGWEREARPALELLAEVEPAEDHADQRDRDEHDRDDVEGLPLLDEREFGLTPVEARCESHVRPPGRWGAPLQAR